MLAGGRTRTAIGQEKLSGWTRAGLNIAATRRTLGRAARRHSTSA